MRTGGSRTRACECIREVRGKFLKQKHGANTHHAAPQAAIEAASLKSPDGTDVVVAVLVVAVLKANGETLIPRATVTALRRRPEKS